LSSVVCVWGQTEEVCVLILEDLSCSGRRHWKHAKIDKCVAPIVKALQDAGIDMRGSCCGHGKVDGHIELADGRLLIICDDATKYLANS